MADSVAEPVVVAIDGPAGSGKSSVARAAAQRLGYGILDTGAAYRALTYATQVSGADPLAVLDTWELELPLHEGGRIMLQGADITEVIRQPAVANSVSQVSKIPAVRQRLNEWFRDTVAKSGLAGVVIEGRDITTVVAPDARVRIILTAAPQVRAKRRHRDLPELTLEQVAADLAARDAKDLEVVDFLNPAPGVTLLDTSELDFAGSVQAVVDCVTERAGAV